MITTLFDTVGRLCVTWPWRVLALFGVLALGTLPLVAHLSLEADVRNMLPGEMAQTLERSQHALRDVRPRLAPRADDPGASQTT